MRCDESGIQQYALGENYHPLFACKLARDNNRLFAPISKIVEYGHDILAREIICKRHFSFSGEFSG
jgi:hypothetical protein